MFVVVSHSSTGGHNHIVTEIVSADALQHGWQSNSLFKILHVQAIDALLLEAYKRGVGRILAIVIRHSCVSCDAVYLRPRGGHIAVFYHTITDLDGAGKCLVKFVGNLIV